MKLILMGLRLMEVDVKVNEKLGKKWGDVVQRYMERTFSKVDGYEIEMK